jgi:hypothetical protein
LTICNLFSHQPVVIISCYLRNFDGILFRIPKKFEMRIENTLFKFSGHNVTSKIDPTKWSHVIIVLEMEELRISTETHFVGERVFKRPQFEKVRYFLIFLHN